MNVILIHLFAKMVELVKTVKVVILVDVPQNGVVETVTRVSSYARL